jgi:heme-degrading monooxygenase HmoA
MFTVIFEVHPGISQKPNYLALAKSLRPDLLQIDGFIDNTRYDSLRHPGWMLALSTWDNEHALKEWRTHAKHEQIQVKGREQVFSDYHLRIGQVLDDTRHKIQQGVKGEVTKCGEAEVVLLIDLEGSGLQDPSAEAVFRRLDLPTSAEGLMGWDAFNAVLQPGDVIALLSWQKEEDADAFSEGYPQGERVRIRKEWIIRDYGKFERAEAPRLMEDVPRDQGEICRTQKY